MTYDATCERQAEPPASLLGREARLEDHPLRGACHTTARVGDLEVGVLAVSLRGDGDRALAVHRIDAVLDDVLHDPAHEVGRDETLELLSCWLADALYLSGDASREVLHRGGDQSVEFYGRELGEATDLLEAVGD